MREREKKMKTYLCFDYFGYPLELGSWFEPATGDLNHLVNMDNGLPKPF